MPRHLLAGSDKALPPGAADLGEANPAERLEVSVLLRRRASDELAARMAGLAGGADPPGHLSREEFAARHGADPADAAALKAFADGFCLAVADEDLPRRTVVLSGTVAQFNRAFDLSLRRIEHPAGTFRGRTGAIYLPEDLAGVVEAVLGLDDRPQASPHFRLAPAAAAPTSYTPLEIAAFYGFPAGTGAGECIAIIELGGGYRPADLAAYFKALGVTPAPKVKAVSVDQGRNAPTGNADGPDGEVMLDIEVAGAIAPAASIVVYFAPNTDAGFIDAVATAAHDAVNKPQVISISWGGPESNWTAQSTTALDEALQAAASMGITVCVASGDSGSGDGVADRADHVDFPASSPWVLACGGTSVRASVGAITAETVWNDGASGGASGGGVSGVFPLPAWQRGLAVTRQAGPSALAMRGVPDVSGDADPRTGYAVRIDGADTVIGGTSAVAPLWAALLTRINAAAGRPVGFINPALYAHAAALNDVQKGDNGDFVASVGWDACTGLGSPKGADLETALAGHTPV
ncbi:MAG TPA: S53 family peptidase [Caulobacteraceae bacterium]|nr:S53 family peptidase [Caulobacteraceae bacterium]